MSDVLVLFYYFSKDPKFAEAQRLDAEDSKLHDELGTAFAARFGGVPLYEGQVAPHFAGIGFKQGTRPKHPQLWTNPKKKDPRWAPRRSNFPARLAAEAKRLQQEWDDNYPHEIAKDRTSHVLEAIGLTKEQVPGNILQFFVDDGETWIACSVPLEGLTEIKGSEYDAGRTAYRAKMQMKEMSKAQAVDEVAANEEAKD